MGRPLSEEANSALQMVLLCRQFRCLPDNGGLFQQSARNIRLLTDVSTILSEKERLDSEKQMKQAKANSRRR